MGMDRVNKILNQQCDQCRKDYKAGHGQRFCSPVCRTSFHRKYNHCPDIERDNNLTTATIGSIHEYQVSVDLMRRGWQIFKALSPNGPVDLVAIKADRILRVQVTKGSKYKSESKRTERICHGKGKNGSGRYDLLAISMVSGEIVYIPTLE